MKAICWLSIGTTRFSTGFFALNWLSRKLPRTEPDSMFVPDRVMARTCTPDDRPECGIESVRDVLELGDRILAVARLAAESALG